MTRRNRTLAVTLAAALVGTAACARAAEAPTPFVPQGESTILITVDNQDYRDATLWMNWNGTKQRVGTVTGKTARTFTTPWRDYQVRLSVDFLGGGELPPGDPITVTAGEHIDYVILPGW